MSANGTIAANTPERRKRERSRLAQRLAGAALCWLVAAGSVHAEEPYEVVIRNAISEYEAGRYEEATALFVRAHAMQPSARTHRGLGLAYFEASRYSLAIVNLRAALADRRRPLTADQRLHAETVLAKAEQFVARVQLQLEPSDATVRIDGHAPERDGKWLLLDPGRHELVASAPRYTSERIAVDARASAELSLRVVLLAREAGASEPPADAHATPGASASAVTQQDARAAERPGVGAGPFIVMGAGAALIAGAGISWLLANGAHDDLEAACPERACTSASFEDDVARGTALVAVTNVLLIAGAVTVAAGGAYWALASTDRDDPALSAACSADGCSAALHATF